MSSKSRLRLECKGIALFQFPSRLFIPILALLIFAGGCSTATTPAVTPGNVQADLPAAEESLLEPADLTFGGSDPVLKLEMDQVEVQVGITLDEARKLFPRPGRSFPIQDLPPGLDPQFEVTGWEQGPKSIGMISSRGRVALFLEIEERADEELALEQVSQISQVNGMPSKVIHKGQVRYWFWDSPGERLMVCLSPDTAGRLALSTALGHPSLMTALKMNPEIAEKDAAESERLRKIQPAPPAEPEKKEDSESPADPNPQSG
jgi:hypothetical protein